MNLQDEVNRLIHADHQKEALGEVHSNLVIRIIDTIIRYAVELEATDIHIEPFEDMVRVRFRIDGILEEVLRVPARVGTMVVPSIKAQAYIFADGMGKKKPLDGRYTAIVNGEEVELRISIFPMIFGEKAALRVLRKGAMMPELERLGFESQMHEVFLGLIHRPNGIFFVTGPVNSGKTTTLYAALRTLNSLKINIVTIEDPIEYKIVGINQSQIDPVMGFTFAEGLRAVLRQDPNIILVGEIRDAETAEIAIRASLTGTLVFSTLHTNNAAGSVARLLDMGIEPFLVSSSIVGVLNQRLVRRICDNCKESEPMSSDIIQALGDEAEGLEGHLMRGKGCANCRFTGYKGRLAIFELLVPNDEVKRLILKKASAIELRRAATMNGMVTLRMDGFRKVRDGLTTLEEVIRITGE